jgi:hypothetical protein
MKVLSLLQPWASLVICGKKKLECRSWQTTYRGTLLIHASAKRPTRREKVMFEQSEFFKDHITDMNELPYGSLIGSVKLIEIYRTEILIHHPEILPGQQWQQEFAFDDFSPGRYAWQFIDPQPLSFCLPMKGTLGLWEYNGMI